MNIGVTGHRPNKLWGYNLEHPNYTKLYNKIIDFLKEKKPSHCITGMALGVDIVFAIAVIDYIAMGNICTLEAAIPCKNHSSKWINNDDIERYNYILSKANKITLVSEQEYTSWCMQKRNEYIVDNIDLLFAIWNGTKGGTKNCIDYAKKKNKKIEFLNPNKI